MYTTFLTRKLIHSFCHFWIRPKSYFCISGFFFQYIKIVITSKLKSTFHASISFGEKSGVEELTGSFRKRIHTLPNIGKSSTIVIDRFMVKCKPNNVICESIFRKIRGFFTKFLYWLSRVDGFWSIHSQESYSSFLPINGNINSISIYDIWNKSFSWFWVEHFSTEDISIWDRKIPCKSVNTISITNNLYLVMCISEIESCKYLMKSQYFSWVDKSTQLIFFTIILNQTRTKI